MPIDKTDVKNLTFQNLLIQYMWTLIQHFYIVSLVYNSVGKYSLLQFVKLTLLIETLVFTNAFSVITTNLKANMTGINNKFKAFYVF